MCLGLELVKGEGLKLKSVTGHGGIFKTPKVAQQYLADALNAPVTCLSTAGEGGAWGMAILAAYTASGDKRTKLEAFLAKEIFRGAKGVTLKPGKAGVKGFAKYQENFRKAIRAVPAVI